MQRLAFENLLVLISPKLQSKRQITYTNCCKNYFNEFYLEWMKCLRAYLNKLHKDNLKPALRKEL